MDWKKILRQAKTGDPVELDSAAFDDDTLEKLPEGVSLLIPGDPTYWISRDGTMTDVQIEWSWRASFWDHKFNLRVFVETMVRAIRLRTSTTLAGLLSCSTKTPRRSWLGVSDPATIRATLRKIGVTSIVVSPDGQGGWSFKGDGDFSGLILGNGHRRAKAAPYPPSLGSAPA